MTEKVVKEEREMEFDIVSYPHPHPLIYYQDGKLDGQQIMCIKCNEIFRPPAFMCSEKNCNFNIHQSCIKLPKKIHSPFHNHSFQTPTLLVLKRDTERECNCCMNQSFGLKYSCEYCYFFRIDVQCAIADPNASSLLKIASGQFRHFSHNLHPLTLHLEIHPPDERKILISFCLICKGPIKSRSNYYFCPEFLSSCDSYTFHQECAEQSRKIFKPHIHSHPLILLPKQLNNRQFCFYCGSKCTDFFYYCLPCDFSLHVHCLKLFHQDHEFRIFPNEIKFKCRICSIYSRTFPWICSTCLTFAHESCAIDHMSKYQLVSSSPQTSNVCDNEIDLPHFSHEQHKLILTRLHEDMVCDGCMRYIPAMSESYACPPCGFYLHKQCATLPSKYINPIIHRHKLSLVYIPDFMFSCALCFQHCHGFAYQCEYCCYAIDIRCNSISFPFMHPEHSSYHPLAYFNGDATDKSCTVCEEKLNYQRAFFCDTCDFYLDVRCAFMPLEVVNRFDEHPLMLTFIRETQINNEVEYYCDICEKERDPKKWYYECMVCCFAAHTKCVLGDYPFLKSAKFKNHQHPLNFVNKFTKKNCSSRSCVACGGTSREENLVFKCGNTNCNFIDRASSKCYIEQLNQEQISLTMPSLRYRSISLHPDHKWKLTTSSKTKLLLFEKDKCQDTTLSFVSQGNRLGEHWDDGVFSSIKSFRFQKAYNKMGIQIEYEDKDGNSIWKDMHGFQDMDFDIEVRLASKLQVEVRLNHPHEYITSIHGLYSENGIQSLSFETNQRTLGPYESSILSRFLREKLMPINFPPSAGMKIVGFHGRSIDKDFLTEIGFHFIQI